MSPVQAFGKLAAIFLPLLLIEIVLMIVFAVRGDNTAGLIVGIAFIVTVIVGLVFFMPALQAYSEHDDGLLDEINAMTSVADE